MFTIRSFKLLSLGLILVVAAQVGISRVGAQEKLPDDEAIVQQAASYSLDKLEELLGVYDRLGKRQVTQALADEILKRDPQNATALAVREGRPVAPGVEPESGADETPQERLENEVESLQNRGRYGELISLLERSKREIARGEAFPFQDDLADAYFEAGDISAAKSAYREMAASAAYGDEERASARRELDGIESMERVAKANELSQSGNHAEALAIIEDLRKGHRGGVFPFQNDLGDILLAAGDFDGAQAAFAEVVNRRGYDSGQRREARSGLREVEKERSLRRAQTLLKARRLNEAMAVADELENGGWKGDEDVQLLRAEVMLARGENSEAIALLSRIKEGGYDGRPFPGQADLAGALYRSNKLHEAASAFSEIVDGGYLPLEKEEAAIGLRDISRELGGSMAIDLGYITEEEGDTWSTSLTVRSPIYHDDLRLWAFARRDDLDLSSGGPLLATGGDRFEGGFAIEKFIDETLSLGGYVGGSDSDHGDSDQVLFGGSFEKRLGRGKWGMDFAYNERAIDSIALQVLDGRQHRVQVDVEVPLGDRLGLDGFVYYRQVEALGDEIGTGFGGEVDLLYSVREADGKRPAVRVGYAGEYHKFDGNRLDAATFAPYLKPGITASEARGLAGDLVEEEINLHGLKVEVEGRLNHKVSYFASAAMQYDFFDEEIQYSAGAGLELYLSDRTRLTAGLEYYSAGQTSSSDAGVVLGTVGVSIAF